MSIKPGSASTEWKIVLMNYVVGLLILGMAMFLEYRGKDATHFMAIATGFLTVNGVGYGAIRTIHKNKALETSRANVAPQPAEPA